jgi:hypothetical protein
VAAVVEIASVTVCELVPAGMDAGVNVQLLSEGKPLQLSVAAALVGVPAAAVKVNE